MIFATPLWLWGLLLLPLLATAEVVATRRDRERVARFVSRPLWARVLRRPAEAWRFARLGLLLLGTAGIVLALARPQWGVVREKVEREGVDVVLILDTSGSMATEDVPPNRFFLARAALTSLVARLEGDRIGLLAFEGEAYPLVPLTLDADAVGLFLETLDPGIVPAPGSSLGVGLAKGLEMFVDKERRNKTMVLVSDGEDLEGEVEEAVKRAKDAGVVVHTVGVGTEAGQPVPNFDREGNRAGFKKDEDGSVVVSRRHADTLENIARGTGGRYVALSPADTSLSAIASAIEGMEQKSLAREWSYRKRERYQLPLGIGILSLALGLCLPPPFSLRRSRSVPGQLAATLLVGLLLGMPAAARADEPKLTDELLLKPNRLTRQGVREFEQGNHPSALQSFEAAAASRPGDPAAKFNLADGLYKNGKFEEAAALYRALAGDVRSPLAGASRFNLGNALYQKQDYPGAIGAYKDALRLRPEDEDTVRNLELALRAQQKQQQQQKRDQQQNQDPKNKDQQKQDQQKQQQQQGKNDSQKQAAKPDRPKSEEEKEQERFQKETGMPKERAMQLLDALQQNEKDEQKKALAAKQPKQRPRRDW